jgi:hypothetical protein
MFSGIVPVPVNECDRLDYNSYTDTMNSQSRPKAAFGYLILTYKLFT